MSVDRELARRFAHGETDRGETADVVREILAEQPPATALPELRSAAYAAVLDRAEALAADLAERDAAERRHAAERAAALEALADGERRRALSADPGQLTWELVERLSDRSLDLGPEDPDRALELSRLALWAAERVPAGAEGAAVRSDLTALARAQLANAERVAGDLPAAEATLQAARAELGRGTADLLVQARVTSLEASLRCDQSRLDEAVTLAARAARLYRRLGDDPAYGRTLLKLATYHAHRGELEAACERLDEALGHFDAEAEPRLLFAAHANRASYLERAGRHAEAEATLRRAAPLAGPRLDRVRLGWIAARVALGRGDTAAAEEGLTDTRRAFLDLGLGFETAQASLELAALYAEQGRTAEQLRLAEEMVPLFEARGVEAPARAAAMLFCDAARKGVATAGLARRLADYFDRARERPRLAFEDSQG